MNGLDGRDATATVKLDRVPTQAMGPIAQEVRGKVTSSSSRVSLMSAHVALSALAGVALTGECPNRKGRPDRAATSLRR